MRLVLVRRPPRAARSAETTTSGVIDQPVALPLVAGDDGRTHLIDAERYAIALAAGEVAYRVRCGSAILPASLTAPQGPRCRACHR